MLTVCQSGQTATEIKLWASLQEYRRKYDLDTLVKEEEEDSAILATARATVWTIYHTISSHMAVWRSYTGIATT